MKAVCYLSPEYAAKLQVNKLWFIGVPDKIDEDNKLIVFAGKELPLHPENLTPLSITTFMDVYNRFIEAMGGEPGVSLKIGHKPGVSLDVARVEIQRICPKIDSVDLVTLEGRIARGNKIKSPTLIAIKL
jgi:hypothetical protein